MSRSRSGRGMQSNVEAALGLRERKGPPEVKIGYCYCGGDGVVGTDQEVVSLRARGLAFGRMVDYCGSCGKLWKVYPGPKMVVRQDFEDGLRYYSSPNPSRHKKVARAMDPGTDDPPISFGGAI